MLVSNKHEWFTTFNLHVQLRISKSIAEKYRAEPGLEPRASRLTYERSTT